MDPHDIFRQLTRGARFTKRKPVGEGEVDTSKNENTNIDCTARRPRQTDSEEEESFNFLEGSDARSPAKKRKVALNPDAQKKQLEDEMVAKLRKEHRITVLGKNIPPPISSFEELQKFSVPERVVKNLSANYPQPTPIQMQAMPIMLHGRSLMACAPTGSGKTIAFLAPIISALGGPKKVGIRAIILAPTRELAQQTFRECSRLSEKSALKVHFINKASQVEQHFGSQSSKKFDILISTPNRVRFLLEQSPPLLDLRNVEWFVIDEADRLMEEGQNNFKDQLDVILMACSSSSRKLALFSATYTVPVAKWALKNIKNLLRINIGQQNSATETVDQELLFVGSESGKLLAMRDLVRSGLKPPVLVFVQSKDRAKELFEELLYDGINVDVIHADRTQQQRDNCVRAFREGNIWVLICTELMGRGIDFKGVNLVINYDFPPSTIAYIHRIGRAGRAGRRGKAITFFTENDAPTLRSIAQIVKNSGGKVPDFMLHMKKPRKSEVKKLANFAPDREHISTNLKSEAERQMKLEGIEKVGKTKKQIADDNKGKKSTDKKYEQRDSRKKLKGHGFAQKQQPESIKRKRH